MTRPDPETIETMADLRACIDQIDSALVALLAERERFTDRAPELKARERIAANAPRRVAAVLTSVRDKAERHGLDPDLAERLWRIMIDTVIAREEAIIGKGGKDG
ncbi:chorismate mutase [Cognatishimia sp. F0-27]|uniref:chorismate mutase n=1 Tax=Cognatishimia sp. F0-27 TaxID=2816855 RepID=UPI001D0C0BAE|nr:chorismate mutase [Cognatishimia sp. F0-27]MCC1493913.1 chorismate mutase [Cognatishimia sp. F0-27]